MTKRNAAADAIASGLNVPGICSWAWNAQTGDLAWSDDLLALYGVEAAPLTVEGFFAVVHPEDRERIETETFSYIGSGESFSREFRVLRPDGEVRHVVDRGRIFRDAAGKPLGLIGVNVDVTELKATDEARESSIRRSAFAARMGGLASWEVDVETGTVFANPALAEMFGLPSGDTPPVTMDAYIAQVHPDDIEDVRRAFEAAMAPNCQFEAEYRVFRDGEWRWARAHAEAMTYKGRLRLVGFCLDIDVEKRRNARTALVARELAHRVKNVLATVQAVAFQTFPRSKVAAELDAFSGRIRAMASSNDLLLALQDGPVPIRDIIRQVIGEPTGMGDRIHVSGDVAVLSEERALPVVLGLHELCTNAIKYGSLSSATGSVTITCSADQQGNIARIVWQEAGGPLVETPKRVGFGTRLLTRLLAQEFGGKVQIEFAPDGVRCAIEMAMPKTRARTAKHTPVAGRDMVGKVMGARGRD